MIVARPKCALALLLGVVWTAGVSPAVALWPASGGGPLDDSAFATVTDQSGNIYVAGEFRGGAVFGGTTYSAEGLSDIFVAKYSPDGALVYVRTAGGPSVDRATALAVDAAQNVYLTGYFTTSATFRNLPSSGVGTVNLPHTNNSVTPDRHEWFIARLQANGDWGWARQIGGDGQDEGYGIAIAPGVEDPNNPIADGVIAVGRVSCPHLYEDDGAISTIGSGVSCGRASGLAVRIDTAGNWVWALEAGQYGASEWLTGVAVDANGLVYVSGLYQEATSIATGPPTPLPFTGIAAGGTLSFWQKRDFESSGTCWDSGALEYTSDALNWYDILSGQGDNDPSTSAGNPARFTANGYNGISQFNSNPLGGRPTWCYPNGGYQQTTVNLADFSGQSVRFRWRFGSDTSVGNTGWKIDDVQVVDGSSNVLFTDDIESGPGKWSVSSPTPSSTPWATSTGDPHAGATSWFLPDPPVVSDHRLQMLNAVALPEGKPSYFIAKIGGTEVNTPFWQWATPAGSKVAIGGIAIGNSGKLFVAGTSEDAPTAFGGQTLTTNGAFLARLQDNGGSFTWDWVRGASGGQGKAVAVAANGDAYLFGQYASNTTDFDPVQTLPEDDASATELVTLPAFGGARDLFVARIAAAGTKWRWVQTAHPAGGTETAGGVGAGTNNQLYVVGDFNDTTRFGTIDIATQGGKDVFVANLSALTGEWFEVDFQFWTVGTEVVPPPGAACLDNAVAGVPDIVIAGGGPALQNYFYWSPPGANLPADNLGHLYAVQPVAAEIKWKTSCDLTNPARILQTGLSDWPRHPDTGALFYCGDAAPALPLVAPGSCIQPHIAGASVDIEPAGSGIAYSSSVQLSIADRSTDAVVTVGGEFQSRFTASVPGYSVLLYTEFPPSRDLQTHPPFIQIVRTLAYDTGESVGGEAIFTDAVTCEIGQEILEPTHEEHGGKNGHVIFDRAYFDGDGADRAYDRSTRLGQIVPVNQVPVDSNGQDLMAVAWYRKDARTVAWPVKSKRYDCRWPANADKIIIASELGSEVLGQTPLDPLVFTGMRLYNQPDRAKSGFNPNDEHAIFAPANSSSGFNAVFALRSDHTETERNKTSKPYALLKYIRTDNGEWAYRAYQVVATGGGYNTFQYSGTAGNAVFAPYPVRLLGNCPQNEATGTPAFEDYKSQVWAKSAGTMVAEYWYPLQPVFYYDRDSNGIPDTVAPDCVAWLGGIVDDPVDVTYNIVWPTNAPVLLVGETLLGSKRGLPEIAAQAAVEVVFDEKVQRTVDNLVYDPTKSLVRLIDPLEPRFVYLNAIPGSVATDLDPTTGKLIPFANSDGTIQLPSTIVDRISYDSLNKKLIFEGILDESGAGDPFLLLNVLSQSERVRLKQLDGGDGSEDSDYDDGCDTLGVNCSWDEAIESLYRLSRNPNRLDLDLEADRCHLEAQVDPTTGLTVPIIVCATPHDGEVDNGLLLGLQDSERRRHARAAAGGRLHAGAHRRLRPGHRFRHPGLQQRHHAEPAAGQPERHPRRVSADSAGSATRPREHLPGADQRPAAGQRLRRVADAAPQWRLRRQRGRHRVRVVHPSGRRRPAALAAAGSGQRTAARLAAVHRRAESGRSGRHHDRGGQHPDPLRQLVRDPLPLRRSADGRRS